MPSATVICVVVLQNCMDSVKVEDTIDTRGEIPEAITFPKFKTEHEVRLWGFL